MLTERLQQWATLAPGECRIVKRRENLTLFNVEIATIEVYQNFDPIEDRKLLAIVQGSVQQRIVDRGLSLALKVDPGFHRIVDLIGADGAIVAKGKHEITAIALLDAYLDWLKEAA